MDYSTLAADPVRNLYKRFNVESADDPADALLRLDSQLEQLGYPPTGSPRVQVALAWKVLKEPEYRALYDAHLRDHPTSWAVIEYLANFGALPPASWHETQNSSTRPASSVPGHGQNPQQAPKFERNPYRTNNTARTVRERQDRSQASSPYTSGIPGQASFEHMTGHADTAVPVHIAGTGYDVVYPGKKEPTGERPEKGTRIFMGLADYVITTSLGVGILGLGNEFFSAVIAVLVAVAYVVGFEVWTGATPMKHLMGYTVRNAFTGEKLTAKESLMRNWWKLIGVVPGIGTFVGCIAGVIYASSISHDRALVGKHDELVKAEVVKK